MGAAGRPGLPQAYASAVPLGKCRLRELQQLSRRAFLTQAENHQARTRRGAGKWHNRTLANRLRPHRKRLGSFLRVLHGDRLAQVGASLPYTRILFARGPEDGGPHPAGDGEAKRSLDRRSHQLHRFRYSIWSPLGRDRVSSVSALRALLLSGNRICHRAQARMRRSRSAGRAQDIARLPAQGHLFGASHRGPRFATRHRRFPPARARLCSRRRRGARSNSTIPKRVNEGARIPGLALAWIHFERRALCLPMIRTTYSRRSCAASCRATRSTRMPRHLRFSTSCRAPPATPSCCRRRRLATFWMSPPMISITSSESCRRLPRQAWTFSMPMAGPFTSSMRVPAG